MAYIVSKASQDIEYADWVKTRNGLNIKKKSVIIKGGANVLNKKTMETPNGVMTQVSAEDLKFLQSHSAFKRAEERGWMVVCKTEGEAKKKADKAEKDDEGHTKKDGSAQLTKEDFEAKGMQAPVVSPDDMQK